MRYFLPFVAILPLHSLLPSFRFKRPLAATCSSSPLRPLAATRVAASGCKWLRFWNSNTARFATSMEHATSRIFVAIGFAYIMHVLLHMWLCNVAALNTKRTCWLGGKEQLGDQLKLSTVQLLTTSLRNFGGLMSQFHCKTKTQHDKEFVENCGCSEMPPHHHLRGMFWDVPSRMKA